MNYVVFFVILVVLLALFLHELGRMLRQTTNTVEASNEDIVQQLADIKEVLQTITDQIADLEAPVNEM
jgi:F0F1-type ATP synthase membrane subunit b/b'